MRKHILVLAAAALALAAVFPAAHAQTPVFGKSEPVTISPEYLQRDMDSRSLPFTHIEEPY
jgi:hypothetical protein